jgi:hypothetical protein
MHHAAVGEARTMPSPQNNLLRRNPAETRLDDPLAVFDALGV